MAYRVRLNNATIDAEFSRSGTFGRIAEEDSRQAIIYAEAEAPIGGMRSLPSAQRSQFPIRGSHRRRVVPKSAARRISYFIENTSGHAAYVHDGTTGLILPIRGPLMVLHFAGRTIRVRSVDGQRANPWLVRGVNRVIRKYGTQLPESGHFR